MITNSDSLRDYYYLKINFMDKIIKILYNSWTRAQENFNKMVRIQLSREKTIVSGFLVSLAILGSISFFSYKNTIQLFWTTDRVAHSHQLMEEFEHFLLSFQDAEIKRRSYIFTGDPLQLEAYQSTVKELVHKLQLLRQLTADNPNQQRLLGSLDPLIQQKLKDSQQLMQLRPAQETTIAQEFLLKTSDRALNDQIRQRVEEMENSEAQLLQQRADALATSTQTLLAVSMLGAVSTLALITLASWTSDRDLKNLKQVEAALRDSEARFAGIVDIAQEAIISIDSNQKIILFNRGAEQIFGYSSQAALGQPLEILLPEKLQTLHRHHITTFAQSATKTRRMGERPGQIYGRRLNGEEFPAEASISRLEINGQTIYTVILRDITERVRVEARIEQANSELTDWVNTLEQRNEEMSLLNEMSDFLQACLTLEEAYSLIAHLLELLFPNLVGGVYELSASKNIVEVVASWGENPSLSLFAPTECWAMRRGRKHIVTNPHRALTCEHIPGSTPTEYCCLPMMAQGETLGVLHLSATNNGQLSKTQQVLAMTVAEQIALALANLKLRDKLQNQSIRDPLTGLFNRRYMEETLERELDRAKRSQQSLGIIMLDVDRFKRFNDTYGHEAGDIVLRELGKFISSSIRKADIACRYGGEEFILLMPEVSLEAVQQRAEQLRSGIKRLNFRYRGQALEEVTLSLGIAMFPEHGITGEATIAVADRALYRAKKEGRDRIVTAI